MSGPDRQDAARQARIGKGQGLEARTGPANAGTGLMDQRRKDSGVIAWITKNTTRREDLARNSWLKPVAHRIIRSERWRFPRRSVPRGVALGVGVGMRVPGTGGARCRE